jgi:hypothetical protein
MESQDSHQGKIAPGFIVTTTAPFRLEYSIINEECAKING